MIDHTAKSKGPGWPGLVASVLVIVGVLLWMFASKGWLFIAGVGAFGPGILRELGWLQDQDEFQRQAAHRAGYHAYLVGGLVAMVAVALLEWSTLRPGETGEWITLILVVLWMSWMFSTLLSYWGAPQTTSRMLMIFGAFWAVFAIASLIGERVDPGETASFWEGVLGVLTGVAIVAPFFVLAYTARRWPRLTGAILLAISVFFGWFFAPSGNMALSTEFLTKTLLIVPLAASGIALLKTEQEGNAA